MVQSQLERSKEDQEDQLNREINDEREKREETIIPIQRSQISLYV